MTDPTDGHHLLAEHTATRRPRVYTITVTVQVTAGSCTGTNSVHTFTLLAPPPPPPLPTQPSPTFVCVTGPGGSCLQPGVGVSQPSTWATLPATWLTSPVVGGCALNVITLVGVSLGWPVAALGLLTALGAAVQFDESNGNWIVLLTAAMPFHNCIQLASYVFTNQPLPQDTGLLTRDVSYQNLFQPVPNSQLKALKKLPFMRQHISYATVQAGSGAALSTTYRTVWSSGTGKSIVCQLQRGGYRCDWRFQHKGTRYTGYVLIGVTGNSYQLERVVQLSEV